MITMRGFKVFDPDIDMDAPVFKVGMGFANVKEVRSALEAYAVRGRVKVRKTKNDLRRVEAKCDPDFECPWSFKATKHSRHEGGFVITEYEGHHTCEKIWDMRSLTSKFLK